MSLYSNSKWKIFRDSVIELDGFKCTHCGRDRHDVILQVHHKRYISGFKPWEYATQDCETVCKGCHASIHGIIQPKFGWEYLGDDDLGDLVGTCENSGCSSPIRYAFTIYHENWGTLEVGTVCCDNLTDSEIASNLKESKTKYANRADRFLTSKRWTITDNIYSIKQGNFEISIIPNGNFYRLKINNKNGKIDHDTVEKAKRTVFDIIEDGQLMRFFKNQSIDIIEPKRKKREKE